MGIHSRQTCHSRAGERCGQANLDRIGCLHAKGANRHCGSEPKQSKSEALTHDVTPSIVVTSPDWDESDTYQMSARRVKAFLSRVLGFFLTRHEVEARMKRFLRQE
jgi:hypothetical protein